MFEQQQHGAQEQLPPHELQPAVQLPELTWAPAMLASLAAGLEIGGSGVVTGGAAGMIGGGGMGAVGESSAAEA